MHINPNIEKPIFIQIAEQLEDSIFTKVFPEETKIPSTNELSSLLNINPHTVLKGMNLLVDEEIIYKKRGLGMFVKKGAVNKILLKRQSQFYEQYVAALIQEASKLHMKKEEIISLYNNLTALDDVSFSFEFGKIYGLLGRNGAGKSTLINIIANRIFADEGMILVDDIPAKENMQVHEKVFCMSEADLYDKDLKIKEHFRWINRFYDCFDLNKALTIAKMFDLDINKKFRSLSKGYQSIFKLTAALSLNIPYVIFDEPVLGLDANHRELFYELLLQDFENNERTIIIATHLIEEVTNIIEEVVLIDHGKIILQDTVESLLETGYSVSGISHEVDQYCSDKNVIGHDELGNMKIAYILDNKTSIPPDSSLHFSSMNLQKLFVKLTEKGGK